MPDTELDRFLVALQDRLADLPLPQRHDELRELRLHLEALVEEGLATGLDESAATAAAIERFGSTDRIGRDLAAAHHRREVATYLVFAIFMLLILVPGYVGVRLLLDPLFDLEPVGWGRRLSQAVGFAVLFVAMSIGVDVWARRRDARGRVTRWDRYLRELNRLGVRALFDDRPGQNT